MEKRLIEILNEKQVAEKLIDDILESGYIIRRWQGAQNSIIETISDKMYGNKMFSGSFEIDKFIKYAKKEYEFESLSNFVTYKIKNKSELDEILNQPKRKHYIENGLMSFRGQIEEYFFERKIPNPVRKNSFEKELSIMPGIYRGDGDIYKFNKIINEERTLNHVLHELEPNNPDIFGDSLFAYDIMRIEQHYATHTRGLDITFDTETALFFATYKLEKSKDYCFHTKIDKGKHKGVIYCFVFREPEVKKSQYYIDKFDLFETYIPTRVLRQDCGLPLFSDYERNIAICDLDCIIYLDSEFEYDNKKNPKYMFPEADQDKFYERLIELKRKYIELDRIVEYKN